MDLISRPLESLAVSGMISPIEMRVAVFSGLAFIIMFVISSTGGGFQDLIKTTLENDATNRRKKGLGE